MNNKILLKKLPLLTLFAASMILSPVTVMADKSERSHSKEKYSHDSNRADSKSYNRDGKHSNKYNYRSYGKSHKDNRHRPVHRYDNGHNKSHVHYKRGHDRHRYDHHTSYVVNDNYYDNRLYGLDHLRFMIGLRTNNFDITFRD